MKKHRRFALQLACLLCVVGLVSISVPKRAEAAEIYPSAPLKWSSYEYERPGKYSVEVAWYNNNITNTKFTSNFSYAMSTWKGTGHLTAVKVSSSVGNVLTFSMPTESYWNLNIAKGNSDIVGYTYLFRSGDGNQIKSAADAAGAANGTIHSAIIFFCPTSGTYNGYSDAMMRNLIAHEMGHALGFGHYGSSASDSIMYRYNSSIYTLTSYDKTCFKNKYNCS